MRLIDADKLLEDLRQKRYSKRSMELILNQPDIKAIPIEWIKKWCNEHNSKSLEERLLKRYGVITILEDWEKENEKTDEEHN